jgi:preprotein translocase subunit SecE
MENRGGSGMSETVKSSLNAVRWVVVVALASVAVVGNQVFAETAFLYRLLAVVAVLGLAAGLALTTTQGRAFLVLLREANIERRKVIWPTRQETVQTTLIVVVFVFIMALILWGLDSLLSWIVSGVIG